MFTFVLTLRHNIWNTVNVANFCEKNMCNKMKKTKKYHTVETIQKSIPLTHKNDRSLSWLGTGTSINSDRAKLG